MARKEIVKRAVHFKGPQYIPLMYYGLGDLDKTDVVQVQVEEMFGGRNGRVSEWGFEWMEDKLGFSLGQTKTPAIKDWGALAGYDSFDVYRPGRFDKAEELIGQYPDRYFIADFILSGFTVTSFIRGFENFLIDLHEEPGYVEKLLDHVFGKEEELIRECALRGFDAVGLADDWGSQQSLLISRGMFVKFFKPRLKRQIGLAHSLGLDVFLHSCGHITGIIPDLIEIGLDILNPGQPSLNGIKLMGDNWNGKICFACPVSYQTTGITGTPDEVDAEVRAYIEHLSNRSGGFIGLVQRGLTSLGSTAELQDKVLETWNKYCGAHVSID